NTPTPANTSTPTPTPTWTPVASPTPTSEGITLSAVGRKVKGLQKADLSWDPPGSGTVDVLRNGAKLYDTPNDGFHTDPIDGRGGGTYTYQVCLSPPSTTCSNTASVTF
ncbi:MAG TPA: hypothetical protein VMS86_11575, partial [Thermoanaerobaculia bacterium]|nr:hypothetical protein [Thermoanaerobaculia bacterium]